MEEKKKQRGNEGRKMTGGRKRIRKEKKYKRGRDRRGPDKENMPMQGGSTCQQGPAWRRIVRPAQTRPRTIAKRLPYLYPVALHGHCPSKQKHEVGFKY